MTEDMDCGPKQTENASGRTPQQEAMVRFGYYAGMASAQFRTEAAEVLVKNGYEDPRDILSELSAWCYAQAEVSHE